MSGYEGLIATVVIQVALTATQMLLTKRPNRVQGKLSDEQRFIQRSELGQPIPVLHGSDRFAVAVIWGKKFDAVAQKKKLGKGGGGSITNFEYFVDFALLICEGEIDGVVRIWADREIIYDAAEDEDGEATRMPNLNFRVYRGTEDQEPDPTIVADVDGRDGAGSTPAYKGLAYIVFEQFPVTRFGNRLPNFEIQATKVAEDAPKIATETTSGGSPVGQDKARTVYDTGRNLIYTTSGNGSVSSDDLLVFSARSGEVVASRALSDIAVMALPDENLSSETVRVSAGSVGPYLFLQVNGTWSERKLLVRKADLSGAGGIGVDSPNAETSLTRFSVAAQCSVIEMVSTSTGIPEYYIFGGYGNTQPGSNRIWWGLKVPPIGGTGGLEYLWGKDFENGQVALHGIAVAPQNGSTRDVFFATRQGGDSVGTPGPMLLWKSTLSLGASYQEGTDDTVGFTDPSVIYSASTSGTGVIGLAWDQSNDRLLVNDPGGESGAFDPETLSWDWKETGVTGGPIPFADQIETTTTDGRVWAIGSATSKTYSLRDPATGDEVETWSYGGTFTTSESYDNDRPVYDPVRRRGYYANGAGTAGRDVIAMLYNERQTAGVETLQSVVTQIVERGELTASDIDVSGLSGNVRGFSVGQGTLRDMIEPLAASYNFDAHEQDGKIFFKHRTGAVDYTVDEDDLVEISPGRLVEETRDQEIEAPLIVNARHISPERDYLPGMQVFRRIQGENLLDDGRQADVDLGVVLSDDEAFLAAQRINIGADVEREKLKAHLPPKYLDATPNDVIRMTANSRQAEWRGQRLTISGEDGRLEVETVRSAEHIHTAALPGVTPPAIDFDNAVAQPSPRLIALPLDIPYLRDEDAQSPGVALVHMGVAREVSATSPFTFAQVSVSTDGGSIFTEKTEHDTEVTWGVFETALADIPGPAWNAVQEVTARVRFENGEGDVESVTEEAMIGSLANACAVIKRDGSVELVHFRTATDTGDGVTFDLKGWLRGRRGTEGAGYDHEPGEVLVLLETATVEAYTIGAGALGRTDLIGIAGPGQDVADNTFSGITHTLAALKPLAPVGIAAVNDGGDIDITWTRRTRIGGENDWNDGVTTVPLSEESESYRVDIYDTDGTTLLRTLTSASESVNYPSADVTADFGSVPASVHLLVRQVSESVGPGFGRVQEIEVN